MKLNDKVCKLTLEIDNFLFDFNDIFEQEDYFTLDESVRNDLQASKELLTSARDLLLSTLKNIKR